MLLYSGKSGCTRKKWLCSGKEVVFGNCCCVRAEMVELGQSGIILEKSLYSAKVVVFVQKLLYMDKSGSIRQMLLYSGKSKYIREKVVVFVQSG